ncbi:hypothetical protein LOK74_00880 [Brevibacillus humidisoli]|uniref:N-acyl amino acid synthase FeeM domain-containing protein n=1 Tax=Brevibacillus humidisoli TaxID=2895522 RepID=UPI001E57F570|nr:hypothetical protein [Brevibacillus humidisoli]UFJ41149.1 hypothetical protein LOK74_00880 [Brevibacillus humidisoli]
MIGRIERIQTAAQLDQLYQFRHQVFVGEEGHLPPSADGRITDRFDAYPTTYNFAAFVDDVIVAGLRMNLPSEWGTPADEYFDFAAYLPDPLSCCAGGSMLCIARRYRRSRALFTGLLGLFYYWTISYGLTHVYAVANPERQSFFVKSGFRCLTPAFFHQQKQLDCLPVALSMKELPEPYRTFVDGLIATHGLHQDLSIEFELLGKGRYRKDSQAIQNG